MEALALSDTPLTAYRVAKEYNMNIAKVYAETKRLAGLGIVSQVRQMRGTEYELVDEDLRRLALRLASRTVPYEEWNSREQRASRFRGGLRLVPSIEVGEPSEVALTKETRLPGELEVLARLGRKKFDAKYRRVGDRSYDRL